MNQLMIKMLEECSSNLGFIYNNTVKNSENHYYLEYVYALRSLVNELRQKLDDEYFSLDYINENLGRLLDCAREIDKKWEGLYYPLNLHTYMTQLKEKQGILALKEEMEDYIIITKKFGGGTPAYSRGQIDVLEYAIEKLEELLKWVK